MKWGQDRVGPGASEVRGVGCHGLTWLAMGPAVTCSRTASIACRESCHNPCYGYSHAAHAVAALWLMAARGACRDDPRLAMAAHDKQAPWQCCGQP